MKTLKRCACCGREFEFLEAVVEVNNTYYEMCVECATYRLNSCFCCENREKCEFSTNEDPLPKTKEIHVTQQTHFGKVQTTQIVMNEERIEKFCKPELCKCCDNTTGKLHCARSINGTVCPNYKEHIFEV